MTRELPEAHSSAGNLIEALDGSGSVLESTAPDNLEPPGGSGADYVGFSRVSADIFSVRITPGVQGGTLDALWVDNLSVDKGLIPAPGTLALLALGLLMVGARRRSFG